MPSGEISPLLQKKEIDLTHYERKLREWEDRIHTTGSPQLRDWMAQAKAQSAQALDQLLEMNQLTVDFLAVYERQTKKWIAEFQTQRDQHQARMNEFSGSRIMAPLRESLTHYYEDALELVIQQIGRQSETYQRVITHYLFCLDEFRRILLELIFRPDPGSFLYKPVIGALNELASGSLPRLEELGKSNIPLPPVEERNFARTEAALQLYIRQYRDAVTQWKNLGSAYIHIVNN